MSTAPQRQEKAVSAVRLISVSFADKLESGESLTGTPTIVVSSPDISPEDLTLSDKSVSTTTLTINGVSVASGAAVLFKATGGTVANSPYTINISVGTDATLAQTFDDDLILTII